MLVVHCLFSGTGDWQLWAEDSQRLAEPSGPRGRRPAAAAPRRHPFAVPADELDCILPISGTHPGTSVLALPARGARPVPSADLQAAVGPSTRKPATADHLALWAVPTVIVEPARPDAFDLAANVVAGASVGYARALVETGRRLVGEGRVMPALEWDEQADVWRARWVPAESVAGAALRRQMVAAMPPVFRCWMAGDHLTGRPAPQVYDAALGGLVDTFARAALTSAGPLLPGQRGRRPRQVPAVRRWLEALVGTGAGVLDTSMTNLGEIDELAAALDKWRRGGPAGGGAARVCFRLRAPQPGPSQAGPPWSGEGQADPEEETGSGGENLWSVELLLQATDDPSLLATAGEVWREEGNAAMFTDAGIDARRELLAGLGRAARVFTPLERALRHAMPLSLPMDAQGALEFLRTHAPLLAAESFGVLLPSWWTQGMPRLGLRLAASSPQQPGRVDKAPAFGTEQLVNYAWEVALGEQSLTRAELEALAAAKVPLVQVRGQWVEVDQRRLAAGLKVMAGSARRRMTVGDVLRTGLLGVDDSEELSVLDVQASGWLGDLLSGATAGRCGPLPTPDDFGAVLRPYQQKGLGWLSFMDGLGLGAVLADDMGLGKTIQVLALLERERQQSPEAAPTLLVCPMSLVANWQREAARFAPKLAVHVHHGAERLTGEQFRAVVTGSRLVLTTYGLALRDRHELAEVAWHRVVVDEAQAIKNSAAKQSRAVRSLPAPHRIALTGTPVENRLADLHAIMEFASPGLLGSAETFKRRFASPIERDGDTEAAQRLRRATGAFILRRLKTDPAVIADLPDKIEMKVLCNLTKEQASLYQAVVDDMLRRVAEASGIDRRGLVLATLTKLKQVCNHPAQLLKDGSRVAGRSGKLARIEEICEEVLAAGDKALLFTQFAEFGTMLREHLSAQLDTGALFLHGGLPRSAREQMISSFQQPGGPALFVLSLKAGGVGLNLTAANHVIHVDRWWNPAVEDQATDRAFRIGQRRNVQVRKLVCAGTLEERIDRVLEEKKTLAESVVGAGEAWLTELSTEALREMVALAADAVVE